MLQRIWRRPSPAMLIALAAFFVALGGPAQAGRLITGRDVKNHSIGIVDLQRPTTSYLRKTPARSVRSAQIVDRQVLSRDLGLGAVTSATVADGSLIGADVAASSIGAAQLAPGSVIASRLASGAISGPSVANGTLQTVDVGSFSGAIETDFQPFAGDNMCQAAEAPAMPAGGGQANIGDDVVVASPPVGWSDFLVVTAKPAADNRVRIVVCYVPSDPAPGTPPDPGPTTFRYVTFDSP